MREWYRWGPEHWRPRLAQAGLEGELAADVARYLGLLGWFDGALDLLGRVGAEALVRLHVLESLAALPFLPGRGELLDVGSGNGFPAVPLLLARRRLRGTLLEPRERRWAFLREVIRELDLDATVRRERLAGHPLVGYSAMTVRAVRARDWSPEAGRVVAPGGVVISWVGKGSAEAGELRGFGPVITSALPAAERGVLRVWRRCST